MPFFNNVKLSDELKSAGTKTILNETLKDIEEYLEIVAKQINRKTTKEIREFIDTYLEKNTVKTLEELDQKYYEMMIELLPKNENKLTFEEFKELSKTDEFKQMQQMQMKVALDGTLEDALEIIANNPDISTEELFNGLEIGNKQPSNSK